MPPHIRQNRLHTLLIILDVLRINQVLILIIEPDVKRTNETYFPSQHDSHVLVGKRIALMTLNEVFEDQIEGL